MCASQGRNYDRDGYGIMRGSEEGIRGRAPLLNSQKHILIISGEACINQMGRQIKKKISNSKFSSK